MRKLIFLLLLGTAYAQTVLSPMPRQCFNDVLSQGKPLAGGKIYTYQSGTSIQQATFTDSTGLVQNTNPVILDVAGCSSIWLISGQAYRFVAQNSVGVQEWTSDNIAGLAQASPAFQQSITTVTYSLAPTFTATGQYQMFKMTLNGDVNTPTLQMSGVTAPSIVTFELSQDSSGGHAFTWPLNVSGAFPINKAANSMTSETFSWDGTTAVAITNAQSATTVFAQAGETVAHAVGRLPAGGGKVIFDCGTYPSGNVSISTPNVWLQGCGMPNYNSSTAPTALTGGTIIQGPVLAIQGADHFTVKDLGIDTGPTWVNTQNSGVVTDGLGIFNNGQVVGANPVQGPIFENVSCLGFSPSASVHCMIMENVNNGLMHNVQSVYDFHGIVLKGAFSTIDGAICRGHGGDCIIVKSDDYAPAGGINIKNFTASYLATVGDTKGIILQGAASGLSDVNISHGTIIGASSFAIQAIGSGVSTPMVGLNIHNVTADYTTASPSSNYCFQYVQYVELVNISNLNCSNYWADINPNTPQSGFTNEFNLTNSHFTNAANIAIEAYGRWNVTNTSIVSAGTGLKVDAAASVNWCNSYLATVTTPFSNSGTIVPCSLPVTSFTTTAATTDNVSVPGMTSAGHCQLNPTNSGAAGGIASVYVSAKTTDQITVTHTATSGWTFDVACTPN
jgi:hypothetical protein